MAQETGIVKKWMSKGFGFIQPSNGGDDVFVHGRALLHNRDALNIGEHVTYTLEYAKDGRPRASNVAGDNSGQKNDGQMQERYQNPGYGGGQQHRRQAPPQQYGRDRPQAPRQPRYQQPEKVTPVSSAMQAQALAALSEFRSTHNAAPVDVDSRDRDYQQQHETGAAVSNVSRWDQVKIKKF